MENYSLIKTVIRYKGKVDSKSIQLYDFTSVVSTEKDKNRPKFFLCMEVI